MKTLPKPKKVLAEYLKNEPVKLSERGKMESELADAYRADRNPARAAAHAEESYRAAKALFKDWTSRARGINEILAAGRKVLRFTAKTASQAQADKTLDDLRNTGVLVQSTGIIIPPSI